MSNTYERIQQRRQYLKKTGWAYGVESVTSLLALSSSAIAGVLLVFDIVGLTLYFLGYRIHLGTFIIIGTLCLFLGAVSWIFAYAARWAYQEAAQLTYIAPVNTKTLPAEEVLVRGSEEPDQAQRQSLLRGTDNSQEKAQQELLRGSQGQE